MNQEIRLSEKQEQVVLHEHGAILVKASAGSGKTRVLTERIKRLLQKTKREILAITFTNKAAEEMKERLSSSIEDKNRLFIGTFHGFCVQVLENHGSPIGLTQMPHVFESESDRLRLVEQAIQATPSFFQSYQEYDLKGKRNFCSNALNSFSEIKRELYSREELSPKFDDSIVLFYNSYQEILQSQNAIDFDDLISLTYRLFIDYPTIAALYRRNYQYICIDEAQDLNKAQYQLLRALTNGDHKNVMMVGDPNQSIFAFNGSSPKYMLENFVHDFNPIIIELKDNYRSSRKVIEAAEKIIPQANQIVNMAIEGDFEIYQATDETDEAQWIIDKIQDLVRIEKCDAIEGNITYEKIAILARNKYVFNKLEDRLKENNIPYYYKITASAPKFETDLLNVFNLALRIKLNPQDDLHCGDLAHLLQTEISNDLLLLCNNTTNNLLKEILKVVLNLEDSGQNLKSSLTDYSEFIKLQSLEDNEKKMILNEIEEVEKHWNQYAKKTEQKSLHQFRNSMALGQTHPLSEPKGLTLSTVHTMKGQQNEIIFIMGMDEGTFPDYRAVNKGGADLIQEKNNVYVAFTRAKRFLYVTFPKTRKMPWGTIRNREISSFLKDF